MSQTNLPFKIGQIIETKSFLEGYRGAWFQCKILGTLKKKRKLIYRLEYVTYPDEEIHEINVFEKPEGSTKDHLMVRPSYPPFYHESEIEKIKRDCEPLVVVHGSWKVGDLVDWSKDDCYWSAKIVELKDDETVQVELSPIPVGEGSVYEGLYKDLRPSLEWSLEDGWKVPISMDGQGRQCAKLIRPKNEEMAGSCKTGKEQTEKDMHQVEVNGDGVLKLNIMESGIRPKNEEMAGSCKTGKEQTEKDMHQVEVNGDGNLKLNIMESDLIEAAVLDLEELITRIEWLKGKLIPDVAEGERSYWKYQDYLP